MKEKQDYEKYEVIGKAVLIEITLELCGAFTAIVLLVANQLARKYLVPVKEVFIQFLMSTFVGQRAYFR